MARGLVGGYDLDGPRVRLGLVWFVALLGAIALSTVDVGGVSLGPWPLAVVLALVAGAAGSQTAAAWMRVGARPCQPVAGLGALVLPLAAAVGTGSLGLATIAMAAFAVLGAALDRSRDRSVLADAGLTLRCGLVAGLAAGGVVLISQLEIGAAVALVLLVCAYDLGDFLIGTGASTPVEGPISGMVAAGVVSFALGVFAVPPFELASALIFGGLATVLFPLGQLTATELLPATDARAPALRRIDSLLLVSPVWTAALWRYLS
jgi:hypothetical protein